MRTCAANADEMMFDETVVMQREPADTVVLRAGALWAPMDLRGRIHIACVRGDLWITRQGAREDIVLRTGEQRALSVQGKMVVQALSNAVFEVTRA